MSQDLRNIRNQYGNVYEISLPNGKYVYVCWIKQFVFGINNYISEIPLKNINKFLSIVFKTYQDCK